MKEEEKIRLDGQRRKKIKEKSEEELLQIIKDKERKKQLQEALARQKRTEFKRKIKGILEEQERKIEDKKLHIQ